MRVRGPVLFALVLLITLFAPAAVGQESHAVVLHENPPNGDTHADNLNRFGWALLDARGAPQVHQDAEFVVTYRNTTLFATTAASGHDYDGIGRYMIAFPGAGDYSVDVRVPGDEDATASFAGVVHEHAEGKASLQWDPPTTTTTGEPMSLDYRVVDAQGETIRHAQVDLEIWNVERDSLVFKTDTHAHDPEADHALDYVFEEAGEHQLRLSAFEAFAGEGVATFAAFTTTHTVDVEPGPPGLPGLITNDALENRVDRGSAAEPYRIFASYDPYTSVGAGSPIRLVTSVVDSETGRPVEHLDYDATITGPHGDVLFEAQTLHSFDGILEITTSHQTVGDHRLVVEAEDSRTDWTGTAEFTYSVLPPVATLTPGPHLVTVDGLEDVTAGEPSQVTVRVNSLAGEPFAHGEINIRITHGDTDRLLLAGKLHTHADGDYPFTFTPPKNGDYTLHVDPYSLTPAPPTPFYGNEINTARHFQFKAGGDSDPFQAGNNTVDFDDIVSTGAPGVVLLLVALTALVRAHRRPSGPRRSKRD